MEFEVGETFGISASVDEDDTCFESGDVFIEEHDLDATLVGRSYVNVMVTVSTSPDLVDNISPGHLDTFHASPSCSPPFSSPEYCDMLLINSHLILKGNEVDCSEFSGTFSGCNPFLDLYSLT